MDFSKQNPAGPPNAAAPGKPANWFVRHKIVSGCIGAFVGLVVLGAIVGDGGEKELAAQSAGTGTQTAPVVDQAAIDKAVAEALAKQAASAAPTSAPVVAPSAEPTPPSTPVAKPVSTPEPTPEEPEDAVNFTMPNFVGMNLQDAQDKVQTYGVFFSDSHDLNGSRMQLWDSNWKVCDQNIKPGTKVKGSAADYEGKIDFGTVKIEEACP